jgi:hypothetical protein
MGSALDSTLGPRVFGAIYFSNNRVQADYTSCLLFSGIVTWDLSLRMVLLFWLLNIYLCLSLDRTFFFWSVATRMLIILKMSQCE